MLLQQVSWSPTLHLISWLVERYLIDGNGVASQLFWKLFHTRWEILFSWGGDACEVASTCARWDWDEHQKWTLGEGTPMPMQYYFRVEGSMRGGFNLWNGETEMNISHASQMGGTDRRADGGGQGVGARWEVRGVRPDGSSGQIGRHRWARLEQGLDGVGDPIWYPSSFWYPPPFWYPIPYLVPHPPDLVPHPLSGRTIWLLGA